MSKTVKKQTELSPETLDQFRAIVREVNAELVGGMVSKHSLNYFRSVERMLEIYKPLKAVLADEAAYIETEYHERAGDIATAHSGGGAAALTAEERMEEMTLARRREYLESRDKLERIERIIKQFEEERGFVAIRMYYFNEDADGTERERTARRYTWDEIATLIGCDTRTVRRWKNNIINKIAACMYGMDAINAEAVHWAGLTSRGEMSDS